MRRWLIALFACHFLLGVVGFNIPDHIVDVPRAADALVKAATSDPLAKSQKGLADLEHALGDELPDLPDTLQRRAAPLLSHVMTPARASTNVGLPRWPLLDGPFRPPRRA
ncbi:MAG TPA: hypothetical protein VLG41_08215 [Hydrogenophaga sp.]|uniref:hypothetical protein n=1 Tax=Hydrogenophaga sp. TaxID=1904254 RepID=UPI002C7E890F|nr:hypothetical protein [Hydrogenophaga sp.]HSX92890.1 hypothetical protein [Hydrogenophaga sp.]